MGLRRRTSFVDEVRALVEEMPDVDPAMPPAELAVLGQAMSRLGQRIAMIGGVIQEDVEWLREMGAQIERSGRLKRRERSEAEARIARVLDGEKAGDAARAWWDDHATALAATFERSGRSSPPSPFPDFAASFDLRVHLRQMQRLLRDQ